MAIHMYMRGLYRTLLAANRDDEGDIAPGIEHPIIRMSTPAWSVHSAPTAPPDRWTTATGPGVTG